MIDRATSLRSNTMQQPVAESNGGAPNEIEETMPMPVQATGEVEEAEASTGRKQILPLNMISTDVVELTKLLEVNGLGTFEQLKVYSEVLEEKIQEAKSNKPEKKRWWKKGNKGESKPTSKAIIVSANDAGKDETADKGDSKPRDKVTEIVNNAEKFLKICGDIGYKPALPSGNKVASESFTLLQQALKGVGNVHYAAVGLSMVAFVLERVKVVKDNFGKCLALLERMHKLVLAMVDTYEYLPENGDLLQSALTEIIKGVCLCSNHTESGFMSRFGYASVNKDDFDTLRKTMEDLSHELVRASGISTLKKVTSIHKLVTAIHNYVIAKTKSVVLLEGDTSHIKNMTEYRAVGNPVIPSLELERDACTKYVEETKKNLAEEGKSQGFFAMRQLESKFPNMRIRLKESGFIQESGADAQGVELWRL